MPQCGARWGAISRKCALCSIVTALLVPSFRGQSTTQGVVGGMVAGPGGAALGDAEVDLTNTDTGHIYQSRSDAQGNFRFLGLPPGIYEAWITQSGFARLHIVRVPVEVGRFTPLPAHLAIAHAEETIEVREPGAVLDLSSPALSTNIDGTSIDELPSNSRRWSYFALLTPAVAPDQQGYGLLSFRGISVLLNNNTLDGADNNQAFFSEERGRTRTAYFASQASVREFQVNTSNYSAEYGRAAGGAVNTVTRSGTNHLHGSAFLFDRDNAWGARNPFTQLAQLQPDGTVTAVPVTPTDNRQQWGIAAGGPVRTDRIFWFFTYDQFHRNFPAISRPGNITKFFDTSLSSSNLEILRERLGVPLPIYALEQYQQFVSGLIGETGPVPRTASQIILFPKLDWQLNDRNHLSLQYNYLRWNSPHGALSQTAASYGVASFGDDHVTDDVLIGRWNTFLTANLMHELRVQYGRDFESQFSAPPSAFDQPFSHNPFGRSPQITLISSGSGLRIGKPPTLDRAALPDEHRTQVASTLSYVRGNHLFKLGYDFNHVLDGIDSIYNGNGSYDYSSLLDFASDALAPSRCDANGSGLGASPCYNYFTQQLGPQAFSFDTNDYAVFLSDEWKVKHRLTLSYGVRYEYEQLPPQNKLLPNPSLPQTGFIPSDRNNYGPRVGAAYDLTGHGNTVLRGGYGIYFGRIINSTIFSAYTQTGSPASQLGYYFRPGDAGAPAFPYIFTGKAVVPEKPTADYFDSNFQNPRVVQAEASLAQRISPNTEVTVSYLRSTGQFLPNFMDTNIDLATAVPITYTVKDPEHQGPLQQSTYSTHLFTQRLNPAYGSITDINSMVASHYQAIVVKVAHNGGRWLHLRASYTYAHAQDNNQNETTFTDANDVLDPTDLALEYADSNFDVRQRATAGIVLRAPWKFDGWRGALANGYALAPTSSAQTGLPYSMRTSGSVPYIRYINQFGQSEKLTGLAGSINGSGGATWIAAVGRNTYRYPGTYTVDLRASRTIPLSEKMRLELMVQGFNLLNHQNVTQISSLGYEISGASSASTNPTLTWQSTFGTVTNSNSTNLYRERQLELVLRLRF
ncbi:MAG: carboxypeptidase regulatory-like domain-containing protein [Acidobacteriaceae bacterium]